MSGDVPARDPAVRGWFFGAAGLLGLAFALISEPDQAGFSAWVRHLIQWQLQTLIPISFLILLQLWVSRMPSALRGGQWGALLWTGLLGALFFTPLALAIDVWIEGEGEFSVAGLTGELFAMGPPVIICWVAINAPFVLGFSEVGQSTPGEDPVVVAQSDAPAFFAELPEGVAADLIYLVAELHYLSVVTTRGRALILYNLRDAVSELPDDTGLQVHRSYWVARNHVVALHKAGRQGELELSNGERVPVSRSRLPEVRAAFGDPIA